MKIVFTPDWFLGIDVLINLFSFLILAVFFFLSLRSYKTSKKKNSLYLGIGFLLIALAQLAAILTKTVLYYDTTFTNSVGRAIVTYHLVQSVDIFYYIGFFLQRLLALAGLFIIYRIYRREKHLSDLFLIVYLLTISASVSTQTQYIFHFTALILTLLIINNYIKLYKLNKNQNTLLLIAGFCILALSSTIFALSKINSNWDVAANIIELVSYSVFLAVIIRILKVPKAINKRAY